MTATATHAKTRMLLLTALFAALTAIGAFLKIPTPWSSFTLQVFFVCMAGVLLGPKYGALSQLVYIALGLMGLPIFTTGADSAMCSSLPLVFCSLISPQPLSLA